MKHIIIILTFFCTIIQIKGNNNPGKPSERKPKPNIFSFYDFCDVCGCSANGGSMGFSTGLNNNFAGIRYIGQQYRSRDGIFNNSPWIDENFNTFQLWGKIPLGKKFLINALVPYHSHNRKFNDGSTQKINGLGDITLLGYFKIISPQADSINLKTIQHSLHLGTGLKIPTGEFDRENIEGSVNPGFQVGTGSWDYIFAVNYSLTYESWGITTLLNYTIKTENDKQYHFGNQWNYAANVYKVYNLSDKMVLTPQAGVAGEYFDKNREFNLAVPYTGGNVFFGRLGIEAGYKRFAWGVSAMLPVSQDLSDKKVEIKRRLSFYLNMNI
ncbi:transporter [Abyssalbus ytuae]|uniref:Transporter n=1 Tax=Abyssalbus ytuae TaxID=2926907 RepID=A0A9E6ZVC5_9FLAO|nr:transporter [Abyssalbus ytuae]UOB17476.1 transporter [Abyssalbus ytuae]